MTDDRDAIDIYEPIAEICNRLGLDPNFVRDIYFTPRELTATVFKRNAEGSKYVVMDEEDENYGEAAVEEIKVELKSA